jgi:PhnB protein
MAPRRNASTAKRKRTPTPKRSSTRTRTRVAAKAVAPTQPRRRPADSGLAPGMQAVNTFLAVQNVAASMEFLERAFGFSRGVVLGDPGGQLRYAEMRHRQSVIMLIQKGDETSVTSGAPALYTYVEDVDRLSIQAREAGAGVSEAEDRPWGDRVAVVTDPDGYRWLLATFKKLVPFT